MIEKKLSKENPMMSIPALCEDLNNLILASLIVFWQVQKVEPDQTKILSKAKFRRSA